MIVTVEPAHSSLETKTDNGDSHVKAGDSRIVQFSQFCVKGFLTLSHLAIASGDVSSYYIDLDACSYHCMQIRVFHLGKPEENSKMCLTFF